jgi:hypothetical protein
VKADPSFLKRSYSGATVVARAIELRRSPTLFFVCQRRPKLRGSGFAFDDQAPLCKLMEPDFEYLRVPLIMGVVTGSKFEVIIPTCRLQSPRFRHHTLSRRAFSKLH